MIIGAPPLAASIIKGTTILAQCTAPLDNNIFFLLFNKKLNVSGFCCGLINILDKIIEIYVHCTLLCVLNN